MDQSVFENTFNILTGHWPFPWQRALYERFVAGDIPESCNLPTGLGKTAVIAIWLIALANGTSVPRRLVYVVRCGNDCLLSIAGSGESATNSLRELHQWQSWMLLNFRNS